MKLKTILTILIFTPFFLLLAQQQRPDLEFEINIEVPKYQGETTALVGVDTSHNNLHTIEGGFRPFARLMEADGYQLQSIGRITEENLKPLNILIIANPIHPSNVGQWKRPIANAFDPKEIRILQQWVQNGGSLMVVADHMPYAGATNALASAFGFKYEDGFVMNEKETWPPEVYSKKQGNLLETIITEDIDSIAGFTGSGLRAPKGAIEIARFPNTHKLLIPEEAWQFENNTERLDATGLVMGAVMPFEKGKVAFFTEAAMFTAQIVQDRFKVGFNSPMAPQNQQFVLNVMHWLDNGKTQKRTEQKSKSHAVVKELLEKQAKAYESNEMVAVANHYTKDGIIYEPTGNEIRGLQDITSYWQQLKGLAVSWDSQILETEMIGNQIIAICRFDISFKRGDETVTARSKAFLTLKQEDGTYKIHRDFYMPVR
ncbi:MAG: hypothetical protein Tsb004_15350 [Allomuricauda sp.]